MDFGDMAETLLILDAVDRARAYQAERQRKA